MITSTSSSQVKHVISLLSKAKERKKNNEYVVEGIRMVSEAPADLLVKIYMSERFQNNNSEYVNWLKNREFLMTVLKLLQTMCLTECHRHRLRKGLWLL